MHPNSTNAIVNPQRPRDISNSAWRRSITDGSQGAIHQATHSTRIGGEAMTRKPLWWAATGCRAAVAATRSFSGGAAGKEFTAVEEARHKRSDGSQATEILVHAVRQEGATVRLRQELGGVAIGNRLLIDPVRKARIVIEPRAEAVTIYPVTAFGLRSLLAPPPRCGAGEGAAVSFRHGFPVYRAERRLTMQDGTTLFAERGLAPGLRCMAREGAARSIGNGVERTLNEYLALRADAGKMDNSLSGVPPHYKEMSPRGLMAEVARRTGRECTGCVEGANHLDEVYWSYCNRQR